MAKLIFISRLGSNDGTVNLSVSASNLWPLIKRSWQSSGHGWKRSKLSGSFLYNLIGSVRTMMFKKNGSKELQILVKNSTIFLTKLRVWDFKNISDVFKMLNWQNYLFSRVHDRPSFGKFCSWRYRFALPNRNVSDEWHRGKSWGIWTL